MANPALVLPPFAQSELPNPSIFENIIAPLDYVYLDLLKLGQPWMRMAFSFAAISAAEFVLKPDVMFSGDEPRSWQVTNPSDKQGTYLPWWLVPASVGLLSATLV